MEGHATNAVCSGSEVTETEEGAGAEGEVTDVEGAEVRGRMKWESEESMSGVKKKDAALFSTDCGAGAKTSGDESGSASAAATEGTYELSGTTCSICAGRRRRKLYNRN
jgi:hypothetical protein